MKSCVREVSSICSLALVQGVVSVIAVIGPEADQTKQSLVGQEINKCLLEKALRDRAGQKGLIWPEWVSESQTTVLINYLVSS